MRRRTSISEDSNPAREKARGWGAKVFERPAKDLATEFPEMNGFSRANLLRMRAFQAKWESVEIVAQPVRQLTSPILSQPVTEFRKAKSAWITTEVAQQPAEHSPGAIVQQPVGQLPTHAPTPFEGAQETRVMKQLHREPFLSSASTNQ
jgi:hypothetical protein